MKYKHLQAKILKIDFGNQQSDISKSEKYFSTFFTNFFPHQFVLEMLQQKWLLNPICFQIY